LRKIVIMVTGLFLLAAALLPTSPAQAMTTTINIDGEKNWNKTINIIVQSWLKPTTIYRNYYVYKSQPGQWQGACQGLVGRDLTHSHIYLTTAFDPIETTHEAHTSPTVDPLQLLAELAYSPLANPQPHEPISGPNFS